VDRGRVGGPLADGAVEGNALHPVEDRNRIRPVTDADTGLQKPARDKERKSAAADLGRDPGIPVGQVRSGGRETLHGPRPFVAPEQLEHDRAVSRVSEGETVRPENRVGGRKVGIAERYCRGANSLGQGDGRGRGHGRFLGGEKPVIPDLLPDRKHQRMRLILTRVNQYFGGFSTLPQRPMSPAALSPPKPGERGTGRPPRTGSDSPVHHTQLCNQTGYESTRSDITPCKGRHGFRLAVWRALITTSVRSPDRPSPPGVVNLAEGPPSRM
jgi:hypothetical protein